MDDGLRRLMEYKKAISSFKRSITNAHKCAEKKMQNIHSYSSQEYTKQCKSHFYTIINAIEKLLGPNDADMQEMIELARINLKNGSDIEFYGYMIDLVRLTEDVIREDISMYIKKWMSIISFFIILKKTDREN